MAGHLGVAMKIDYPATSSAPDQERARTVPAVAVIVLRAADRNGRNRLARGSALAHRLVVPARTVLLGAP